jgi:hypothetical protein
MKTYNKIIALVAAGLACSAVASKASLVSIAPGDTENVSTSSDSTSADLTSANQVGTTLNSPYDNGIDAGTLSTSVYNIGANNPLGGLTFLYTITLTAGSVEQLTLNGFLTSVDFANISTTTPGDIVDTVDYNPGFLQVTLNDTDDSPLTISFEVDTSSSTYGVNIGSTQDGNASGNLNEYAPVPEPTTLTAGALLLLPFGVGALRSLRKERSV